MIAPRARQLILIGERDPAKPAHAGIEASIKLFNHDSDAGVVAEWTPTDAITTDNVDTVLAAAVGI